MNPTRTRVLVAQHAQHAIAHAIDRSEKTIELLAYAIAPAPRLNSILQQSIFARLRDQPATGKVCRALIASHADTSPYGQQNNMSADELTRYGWTVRRWPLKPVMHAKLLIFDQARIITGSHNLTSAALSHNKELSIDCDQPETVSDALQWFTELWNNADNHGENYRARRRK